MPWVMDCSIAGALALPDEHSHRAERFLEIVLDEGEVRVPPLWWYEISNLFVAAMRRKRLTEAGTARLTELYSALPISTDALPTAAVLAAIQRLAASYGLSAYDAAYLELAERTGSGLATLDQGLVRAAKLSGVVVFE